MVGLSVIIPNGAGSYTSMLPLERLLPYESLADKVGPHFPEIAQIQKARAALEVTAIFAALLGKGTALLGHTVF